MNTIDYLTGPLAGTLYWPAIATALVVAGVAGVLSVFVVLKRLAFIGQGVSHAAFGGVALALLLGLGGATAAGQLGLMGVVFAFSIAAALGIARLSDSGRTSSDTAIGIVLSLAMAIGFLLYGFAARNAGLQGRSLPGIESVLFGDLLSVGWIDFWLALGVAIVTLGALFWHRRALLFWAFDEPSCAAFGVRPARAQIVLLVLLAIAVVTAVKLAGIVLATALFVMPGAIALRLSDRLGRVFAIGALAGVVGVGLGAVVSFEADWPMGPSAVLVLGAMLLMSGLLEKKIHH